MTTRRKLLLVIGASVIAAPLFASAQKPPAKMARIAVLAAGGESSFTGQLAILRSSLRDLGFAEQKNMVIEARYSEGNYARLGELAAELVKLDVDVIVASGTDACRAAQKATTTIPIVMAGVADPVGSGLVKSLAWPGGNITGPSGFLGETITKQLELLLDLVPKLLRLAILVNPENSSHPPLLASMIKAAQKSRVNVLRVEARTAQEIDKAFAEIARQNAQAVIVVSDTLFIQQGRQIAQLAVKYRLPSVTRGETVAVGGLMSYGPEQGNSYRQAAIYVGKILKGAKPADLPVEQPTKFELLINGKTAKALGLTIPPSLLISAKVIE
jgi:putative ABC transport system substrate-binding protein